MCRETSTGRVRSAVALAGQRARAPGRGLHVGSVRLPEDREPRPRPERGDAPRQRRLAWRGQHGEASGFLPLDDGLDALGARLRLIERAQRSIDAQYFLIDFQRASRRMHNKSFTVDNVVTIVGGRNIAGEYFRIRPDVEFADFELLGVGPVAPMVSATFDLFWTSSRAVPMEAFGPRVSHQDLEELRQELAGLLGGAGSGVYHRAVDSRFLDELFDGDLEPFPAAVTVVSDAPEKLTSPAGEEPLVLVSEWARITRGAEREVIVITPYFVPGERGVAFLRELRARGLRVVVVTNSLASRNHVVVHSGYAPYRRQLLEIGVELYEVRADAGRITGGSRPDGAARVTLHTKAAIIDRRTLFVGSLDFDPRSVVLITEMGLFVSSEEMATLFAERVAEDLLLFT